MGLLMLVLAACTSVNQGEITGISVTPADPTIEVGDVVVIVANVDSTGEIDTGVVWSVDPETSADLVADGNSATFSATAAGTYEVTATSTEDSSMSATSTVTVTESTAEPGVESVSVAPETSTVYTDDSVDLTATVDVVGGASDAVTWSVSPEADATLDATGKTAQFSASAPGTYEVTVTSDADATKSATSTITVEARTVDSVSLSSDASIVLVSEVANLIATVEVSGASDAVSWSVNPTTDAILTESGLTAEFSATTAGDYDVTVTSVDDPSMSATETITVRDADATHVNTGGPAYTALDGTEYIANDFETGGTPYVRGDAPAIANTEDDVLYHSEWFGASFVYEVPVAYDGNYQVTLHFAEIFLGATGNPAAAVGERVFDVTAEGVLQLDNYDIFQEAGATETAVTESFNIVVTDGVLTLQFDQDAASNEAAKINAIDVVHVPNP